MTNLAKSTLKSFFEQGDVPTGTDYANLIDSCVNLAETSAQTMQGALNPTELITPRVSAVDGIFTGNVRVNGTLSAANILLDRVTVSAVVATTGTFSGAVSALSMGITNDLNVANGRVYASAAQISGLLTGATAQFSGIVSGTSINLTGDVSAATGTVYSSAMRTGRIFQGTGIVSAAGTTQGAAAILTNVVNRGKGVTDGSTTGFSPPGNNIGLVQYLFNEGPSANLWPPTGGFINGLAVNTAFPLVASAIVTIVHLTASAMAVK